MTERQNTEEQTSKPSVAQTMPQELNFIKSELLRVADLKKSFSAEQLKFVKNLINPDLTDNELYLFLAYSNNLQLNPFTKEIIAVVYNKNNSDRRVNTIVTRDGKRVVATRTGELESITVQAIYVKEVEEVVYRIEDGKTVPAETIKSTKRVPAWEGGRLWGATATVIRNGKEFTPDPVPFSEYNTNQNVWKSKPSTMIKKVAESQALSMAFPEILGGVYDESEMPQNTFSDQNSTGVLPPIAGGQEKADENALRALKTLDTDHQWFDNEGNQIYPETITKQMAAEAIKELTVGKAKKKHETPHTS